MLSRGLPSHAAFPGASPIPPFPLSPVSSSASPEPCATEALASVPSGEGGHPPFAVGAQVRLAQRPPYLKSADPMPMLRPPDLIDEGETGVVVELRALGQCAVRFRRGTFLLSLSQLNQVLSPPES